MGLFPLLVILSMRVSTCVIVSTSCKLLMVVILYGLFEISPSLVSLYQLSCDSCSEMLLIYDGRFTFVFFSQDTLLINLKYLYFCI